MTRFACAVLCFVGMAPLLAAQEKGKPPAAKGPPPPQVALDPGDGKWIASAGGPAATVWMWNRQDGKRVHALKGKGRPVFAAGWHKERPVVAWGNGVDSKETNYWLRRPLQRGFDLDELTLVSKPDPTEFQRAVLSRDDSTLDLEHAQVAQGGKKINLWQHGDGGRSGTLLPGERVVIGTDHWLIYYDLKKAVPDGKDHLQTYVFDTVSTRSDEQQHPFLSLPWVVQSFPVR